jgi:hypothetical protein
MSATRQLLVRGNNCNSLSELASHITNAHSSEIGLKVMSKECRDLRAHMSIIRIQEAMDGTLGIIVRDG